LYFHCLRRIALGAVIARFVFAVTVPVMAAEAGRRAPARLVQADAGRIVFQVDVPAPVFAPSSLDGFESIQIRGFAAEGAPGEPSLPQRVFVVAIPPTGGAVVTARVLQSQALGTHRIEPYPQSIALNDELMGPVPGEERAYDESAYRGWLQPPTAVAQEMAYIRHQRVLPVLVSPVSFDPVSGEEAALQQAPRLPRERIGD
jgi:hypothetical protein